MSISKDKIHEMLASTKWGQQFTDDDIAILAEFMEVKNLATGQSLFVQGDLCTSMAFVVDGVMEIIKDISESRDTLIVTLGPGNSLGELSFLDGQPRSASALAREEAQLLVFDKRGFKALAQKHPGLALKIMEALAIHVSKRLRMTTRELVFRV